MPEEHATTLVVMNAPALTHVFIERIAPNAAMLHPHPQEHASAVTDILVNKGWAASMVGPEKPTRGGVLFFDGTEFDDAVLGELATTLNQAGVGAYAHELVDSIDANGDPILVFHRSGSFPISGNRVLLTHTYLFDDQATTWLFGAPTDLADAALILRDHALAVEVLPVYALHTADMDGNSSGSNGNVSGSDGHSGAAAPLLPEAVEVRHLHPTLDSEEAADIASPLVDTLTLAGFSGPIIMTDHREGPDGEEGRLEASY